ncbi:MAG: hypothetical protein KDD69_00175 [Bdellovibrionales bacterium]|nr:hypothetical protein [Bdellovibrionales bacterium]
MLEQQFQTLGYTSSEARVYLVLAEVGKSTAQLVAKRLGIPRTTAYSVLDSLVAKGLARLERKQKTTFYAANRPEVLLRTLEAAEQRLKSQGEIARSIVQAVNPLFGSKHLNIPRLQFFEGREGVEQMLHQNYALWEQALEAADNIWWGYQDHTFVEKYRKWLEHSWQVRSAEQRIQLISNHVEIEQQLAGRISRREIRAVGPEYDFSSTVWVCGEYLILIMTRAEPHYAYQLRDPVLAANQRLVFELLWNSLE